MAPRKGAPSKKGRAVTTETTGAKSSSVTKSSSRKTTDIDGNSHLVIKRRSENHRGDGEPDATHQERPRRHGTFPTPSQAQVDTPHSTITGTASSATSPINVIPSKRLKVFVFGEGGFGELGLGNQKYNEKKPMNVKRPRLNHNLLPDKVGIVQVACGGMHVVALTADNKILTWGVNDLKALGREAVFKDPGTEMDDDNDDDDEYKGLDVSESTPGEVDLSALSHVPRFVQVAATDSASFALSETGEVYGWGAFKGSDGVFGFTQDIKIQPIPIQVAGLKEITSLAAGANHMLALDKHGKVFTWGYGGEFQLGWKPASRHTSPKATLDPHVCGRFTKQNYAVKIAAGSYHSFYINNHGKLWSWGLNNFSQTGHPDLAGKDNAIVTTAKAVRALRDYNIVHVDGGEHHSVAVSADGKLFAWGRIDGHQVGLPKEAFTEENTIIDKYGKPRILIEPTIIPNLTAAFAAVGTDTTIVVTPNGKAYSWGFSISYQTGQGTKDDIETPTLIDNSAIRGENIVWAGLGGQYSMLASIEEE
ncbi:RCC1/BLIP-II [Annulohypoxylon truncatum]|uniref:RCC1/BLIP-II n=1 Tax=Annulohypoxylon truncatum TaxID=327061 RepID=UPI002007EF98|nr:RCC1/BLIP-II [Annulohypoxylon truncatum]KAI1205539.1 RCC1/BLIP-II [Annulohypoxylon truncatum]